MAMARPKEKGAGMGAGLPSLERVGCACRGYATSVCVVQRQLTTGADARSCIRSAYSRLAPDFNGWNTRWSLLSEWATCISPARSAPARPSALILNSIMAVAPLQVESTNMNSAASARPGLLL